MADRYRAYATIRVERKIDGKLKEVDGSGDVAKTGAVPADGIVRFDAGDTKIRRVAFYTGPQETEVCLGSVEINATGSITANVADIPTD